MFLRSSIFSLSVIKMEPRIDIASFASWPIPPIAEIIILFIFELEVSIDLINAGTVSLPMLLRESAAFPRTLSTLSLNNNTRLSIIKGSAIFISPKASIAPFLTIGFLWFRIFKRLEI